MAAVLLVEDDADTREVVLMLLEDEGYSVVCAGDGQEAIAYLASCDELPCLVLLDLQMPRVGGVAVLRWMSGHPKAVGVPVAVISARPEAKGAGVAAGITSSKSCRSPSTSTGCSSCWKCIASPRNPPLDAARHARYAISMRRPDGL